MQCRWCGDPISLLRRLTDREYCCDNHRRRGPRVSAFVVRDLEHDDDPYWSALHSSSQRNQNRGASPGLVLTLMGAFTLILGANLWFSDSPGGISPFAQTASNAPVPGDARIGGAKPTKPGLVDSVLDELLPGRRPLNLRADFSSVSADWQGHSTGWAVRNGILHPGKLRLWKPTLNSTDYDLKFRASVDRRALGWTFRSADTKNYYAAQLFLNRPGKASSASLLRYTVVDSATIGRTELPLPIAVERNQWYNITVTVKGNRFLTIIDGNPVDDWTDDRLAYGGVGFFAEDGESASIEWAEFREHKGFLSRFFAAHLLFPLPTETLPLLAYSGAAPTLATP